MRPRCLLICVVVVASCEPEGVIVPLDASGAVPFDLAPPPESGDGSADSGADLARAAAYAIDGPVPYTHFDATVPRAGAAPYSVTVYLPSTSGAHPALILAAGLGQPAAAYLPYARRLASYGVVTVLRDDPGATEPTPDLAADVGALVTSWLPARNADSGSPLVGRLDLARIGLAGHARGGQAILLAAEGAAKGRIKGVLALDPVDAPASARASLGTIGVPSLFLGETTDESAGLGAPCAPAADNFEVLYLAAPSPSLQITVLGADRDDFEDAAQCLACTQCRAGSADGADVLALAVRATTAFVARVLLADATVGPTLAGAGLDADAAAGRVTLRSK